MAPAAVIDLTEGSDTEGPRTGPLVRHLTIGASGKRDVVDLVHDGGELVKKFVRPGHQEKGTSGVWVGSYDDFEKSFAASTSSLTESVVRGYGHPVPASSPKPDPSSVVRSHAHPPSSSKPDTISDGNGSMRHANGLKDQQYNGSTNGSLVFTPLKNPIAVAKPAFEPDDHARPLGKDIPTSKHLAHGSKRQKVSNVPEDILAERSKNTINSTPRGVLTPYLPFESTQLLTPRSFKHKKPTSEVVIQPKTTKIHSRQNEETHTPPTNVTQKKEQRVEDQDCEEPKETSHSETEVKFDRGRFPMQRRRRGGMKYGTPRVHGFMKIRAKPPVLDNNSCGPTISDEDQDWEESKEASSHSETEDTFDRGRFPMQRRRRGGMKYGKSRDNGLPKTTSKASVLDESFSPAVCDDRNRPLGTRNASAAARRKINEQQALLQIPAQDSTDSDQSSDGDTAGTTPETSIEDARPRKYKKGRQGGKRPKWMEVFVRDSSRSTPTENRGSRTTRKVEQNFEAQQIRPKLKPLAPALATNEMQYHICRAMLGKIPAAEPCDDVSRILVTPEDQQNMRTQSVLVKGHTGTRASGRKLCVLERKVVDTSARPVPPLSRMIRARELGSGNEVHQRRSMYNAVIEDLRPWKKWKGASSDIVSVSWAPDSTKYAVGAAAHSNTEDLQYNQPCNLLFGDLDRNLLWELPDHRTQRPRPETIATGPNSLQGTYNTCDPLVYQTVNSIVFSVDGQRLCTASRDHTLKIWDVTSGQRRCIKSIDHHNVVVKVDASKYNVFATASQCISESIRVFSGNNDNATMSFSSSKAEAKPSLRILPECLQWGTSHRSHMLLAGFSQWEQNGDHDQGRGGHTCLWDINTGQSFQVRPSSQSISAAVWHPTLPYFATGGAIGINRAKRSSRTVVRIWDSREVESSRIEFESPAWEMQDVTFHPGDDNIVTAGCTDGTSYVWDRRWPQDAIHLLCHGESLMELGLDRDQDRAKVDTGVRLSLWGPGGSLYYTGSSDGVVNAWDIRRAPEDVFIRDVAHIGEAIQDAAFSPDHTHLLVGDASGCIHILSSAPTDPPQHDTYEDIKLIRDPSGSGKRIDQSDENPGVEGIMEANHLLTSDQIVMHPLYGPGQGVNYNGPYAMDRRNTTEPHNNNHTSSLSRECQAEQIFDPSGMYIVNEEEANYRRSHAAMRSTLLPGRTRPAQQPQPDSPPSPGPRTSYPAQHPAQHQHQHTSLAQPALHDDDQAKASPKKKTVFLAKRTTPNGKQHFPPPVPTSTTSSTSSSSSKPARKAREGGRRVIHESDTEFESDDNDDDGDDEGWWPRLNESSILHALGASSIPM